MRDAVDEAFQPSAGPQRIGLELEVHLSEPVPALPRWASYEPGGQLELSLPPQRSVSDLLELVESCLHPLGTIALAGVDPWHELDEVPLVLETPRYRSMQALFDERGDAGRRMMRLTGSLQVCVDLLPGLAGREQWLVANLAGPALVAAYHGALERTRIWQAMDPARTAYDGRHLDPVDPVGAYLAFAERASRLPIPEALDDTYHLGTIFPPVRPRGGYLELRYLDSQRPTRELLEAIWNLMYDERVRREALELLLPSLADYANQWGSADPTDLLAIAGVPIEVAA